MEKRADIVFDQLHGNDRWRHRERERGKESSGYLPGVLGPYPQGALMRPKRLRRRLMRP